MVDHVDRLAHRCGWPADGTFHSLRHFFATTLITHGVDPQGSPEGATARQPARHPRNLRALASQERPAALKVGVNIKHTYRGDLAIDLVAPDGSAYRLKNSGDGGADDVVETYTVNAAAEVANGTWKLRVTDSAAQDVGTIDSWSLTF